MASEFQGLRTRLVAKPPALPRIPADLLVVEGPDSSLRFRLSEDAARIGTAANCELKLTDPTVSRVHCEIQIHDSGVRILDLGSTNGTFVDGVRIRDADLTAGGNIRMGNSVVHVAFSDESVSLPLSTRDQFGGVVGSSIAMRRLYAMMERIAPTETTVLIQGETGTGKELVAQALHEASARATGPFVAIDCGAIAENLIESELFGHVRGSFTGATGDRRGVFEEAHGGTLFFDEIGELPLGLQPKLLRALETRTIRQVGSNISRAVDVRVIAATNRPLARSVNEASFRDDLYYRLAVVQLELPPLRARREDIPMLAEHFLERFDPEKKALPPELLATLLTRSWPGNVRELRNFIERAVTLGLRASDAPAPARMDSILAPGLEALVPTGLPLKEARVAWTEQFESVYLRALMKRTSGNVTRAAALAGVNRRFIQRMLARLGMRSEDPDENES